MKSRWKRYAENVEYRVDSEYIYVRLPLIQMLPQLTFVNSNTPVIRRFSRREQEVLDGLLLIKTNKEIAAELRIAERTVKYHVSEILKKLHVRRRVEVNLQLVQRHSSIIVQPALSGPIQ